MSSIKNTLQTPMLEEKFEEKWNLILKWIQIYLDKFPMFSDTFNQWINISFEVGPTAYEQFINFIKANQSELPKFPNEKIPEEHHIQCLFDNGLDKDENKILLYSNNHILAHIVRFICLRKPGDALAVILRLCSDNEISQSEKSKIIAEANKDKGILFWSSEWQSIQGQKGGQKGGLANTTEQFKARSQVGKNYGRISGLSRQTVKTLERLKKMYCFYRVDNPTKVYRFNPPFESFADIYTILDSISMNKPIRNRSSFYKVINGERSGMYGWILIKNPPKDTNLIVIDFYPLDFKNE